MKPVNPSFSVNVDPTNPGQFFACCGMLELGDRLWPGAEGWFEPDGRKFHVACGKHTLAEFVQAIAIATLVHLNPDDPYSSPIRVGVPFRELDIDWWVLHAGNDPAKTLELRRYILGLSLVAFTHNPSGYLRQGCILVLNPDKLAEFVEVYPTGERKPCMITHAEALEFATEAAKAFVVGESKTVPFDKEKAKADVKGEGDTKGKKGKKTASAKGGDNA